MKKLIMSLAMFTATYLLLSIRIGGEPLFGKMYEFTAPATTAAQNFIARMVGSGLDGSRSVGHKLFQNSVPEFKANAGALRSPTSEKKKGLSAPQENIPEAERRELNSLIKNYSK